MYGQSQKQNPPRTSEDIEDKSARAPPPPLSPQVSGMKLSVFWCQQESTEVLTGSRVCIQHLSFGTPHFPSPTQSKQDKSQEPLTKPRELLFRHNPLDIVHTCRMSIYVSRNQTRLLLRQSSGFLCLPNSYIWDQAFFLLSCERPCPCVFVPRPHLGANDAHVRCPQPTSSLQVYISIEQVISAGDRTLCCGIHLPLK